MNNYFFKQALLPDGWHNDVRASIKNGKFYEIKSNTKAHNDDSVLDCVIPAMPNCHSHVFQRTMAGLSEYKTSNDDSFWSWRELMYKYANQIDAKQLYAIACYVYSEMLLAGYASVCEFHYIHRDLQQPDNVENMSLAIINAAHDVGIGLTLLPVLYTQAHIDGTSLSQLQQRFKLSTDEYVTLYHSLKKQLHTGQNIGVCFHSLRAVSLEQIKQVLSQLGENQPIHIHISEQTDEVEQIFEHTGMRPVEWLYDNFNVNHNWCLIHATHLNDAEIEMIAKSKAIVGICPMTEANLGDGVFALEKYTNSLGSFAIGSDSHILLDPFQEMQTLEYSQRLIQQKRIIASNQKMPNVGTFLWNNSVQGGALASQQPVAGIHIGQTANWLSVDTQDTLLTGLNTVQILDTLIFASHKITTQLYQNALKYSAIDKNIVENYKNTLKSLR